MPRGCHTPPPPAGRVFSWVVLGWSQQDHIAISFSLLWRPVYNSSGLIRFGPKWFGLTWFQPRSTRWCLFVHVSDSAINSSVKLDPTLICDVVRTKGGKSLRTITTTILVARMYNSPISCTVVVGGSSRRRWRWWQWRLLRARTGWLCTTYGFITMTSSAKLSRLSSSSSLSSTTSWRAHLRPSGKWTITRNKSFLRSIASLTLWLVVAPLLIFTAWHEQCAGDFVRSRKFASCRASLVAHIAMGCN